VTAGWHCQTPARVQARPKGRARANRWLKPLHSPNSRKPGGHRLCAATTAPLKRRQVAPSPHVSGLGGRGDAAIAPRMRCRGRAGCRPGQTEHGERGKRPARAAPSLAARQGPMPADAPGAWPSLRTSPRAGKPPTWRRRTAGPQQRKPSSRSDVNTSAPSPAQAEERVLGRRRQLHRWATSASPVESPVRGNSHAGFGGRRRADRLA
jgi:hypothetical protein